MPKALSENEKIRINKKLIEVAEDYLRLYGVKKTTVDELVKAANIPKGTFYLFYDSKERLFYEVFKYRHDAIQNQFLQKISHIERGHLNSITMTDIVFDIFKLIQNSFLLQFLSSGDLELVLRKIPDHLVEEHQYGDDLSVEKLFNLLPNVDEKLIKPYSAALRLVMVSILHKKEIGEDFYDEALKLAIKGIFMQMLKEDEYDSR